MESSHDKIIFEDDLIHDDSTSCTSSLATSLSEDPDDLYLGAEANSFDFGLTRKEERLRDDNILDKKGRGVGNKLIICRERYTSFESITTSHTYSSIDSVTDLINARECDASEILLNLGFATQDVERNRIDILSRFNYPSFAGTEDTVVEARSPEKPEEIPSANLQNTVDITESIHKAQEWLAYRTGQQSSEDGNNNQGNNLNNKVVQGHLNTTAASLKRGTVPRLNKLRKKFSKSRQSSFELLLPNLKEEDAPAEAPKANTATDPKLSNPQQDDDGVFTPIRESSLERVLSVVTDDATPRDPDFQEEARQVEKVPPVSNILTSAAHITKTSLLATGQLESFELEEIVSNEDGTEFQKMRHASPQRTMTRRVGVFRTPAELAPPNGSQLPRQHEGASESDGNESSSGFDEDDVNLVNSEEGVTRISPTGVIQSIQKPCCCGTNLTQHPPPTCQSTYVFDITSGGPQQQSDDVATTSLKRNCNNSSNALFSNPYPAVTTVRCETMATRAQRCLLVPQQPWPQVRPKHRSTDARRRRREFATRSALSGDTFVELARALPQSSMVYQDGSYFYRKRRHGCHSFCKQANGHEGATFHAANGVGDGIDKPTVISDTNSEPGHNCRSTDALTHLESSQQDKSILKKSDVNSNDVINCDPRASESKGGDGKCYKKSMSFHGYGHIYSPA
uniref:Uncharacterized protein LOC100187085 n=1 Tax=Phallusia mammillata TaxID=59560 RepID=A0A6F9DHW2_9ASCI|nr:uncharacterized protein LOC100187085 [Phallusia mammillata]